ncbi:hypothetical protein G6L41_017310 [Agrobacterium tumefaciens]|uniref:hypothetical protein n=1 Tax=Agrobacterium tumefaciens TaxID=358 RepID=UPI001572D78F|nr:hypothetical protein [Agrobacterium tumefaciens]WCK15384.1 hypothetical protein G6L41_017310 [Agrobacterium tumefaciens]
MEDFRKAIEDAIQQKNWLAALALSLLIPDICGRIDDPQEKSGLRYARWFDKSFSLKESDKILAGGDCYALRCAITHEGRSDTSGQPAKDVIDKFHFVKPADDGSETRIESFEGVFSIPIDIFAGSMCAALTNWLSTKTNDADAQMRIRNLVKIHEPGNIAAGKMTFPSFGST